MPMAHAYHIILSTYGFWLPNDPRGSWSDFVGSWELARYGRATKVTTRHSLAAAKHDHRIRLAAKNALQRPAVILNGRQALAVGHGFSEECRRNNIVLWAMAILPAHCHLVVSRHRNGIDRVVNVLKGGATRALVREGLHPFQSAKTDDAKLPKIWARGFWKVYLNSGSQIRAAIRYTKQNPVKDGKRRQSWAVVQPFRERDVG